MTSLASQLRALTVVAAERPLNWRELEDLSTLASAIDMLEAAPKRTEPGRLFSQVHTVTKSTQVGLFDGANRRVAAVRLQRRRDGKLQIAIDMPGEMRARREPTDAARSKPAGSAAQ